MRLAGNVPAWNLNMPILKLVTRIVRFGQDLPDLALNIRIDQEWCKCVSRNLPDQSSNMLILKLHFCQQLTDLVGIARLGLTRSNSFEICKCMAMQDIYLFSSTAHRHSFVCIRNLSVSFLA